MQALPLIPDVSEPIALFRQWFADAQAKEPGLAEAMSLATAAKDGKPSVRMVLLKDVGPPGFVFFTNVESRKGVEIAANPFAALCFHWKSLGRQVRAEGSLTFVTDAEADAYWETRPRESQVAAWASAQSRILPAREIFQKHVQEFDTRLAGQTGAAPAAMDGLSPGSVRH